MTRSDDTAFLADAATFDIVRESRVSWFDVRQLSGTAFKTIAATIVGSMSGRRELLAALDQAPAAIKHDGVDELWFDFIADTGDGWNATASIAWLAGRDGLVLDPAGEPTPQPIPRDCMTEGMPAAQGGQIVLPAGRLLVFGGDEVYPTADADTYRKRLIDPFRCARYGAQGPRDVYAIPGNHDWYDGLTSFIRLFCHTGDGRRWIGAWRARQRRSYFALKLPHGWWLWGIDTALETDLDPPQLDFFREQRGQLAEGDRVILCVPNPVWLERNPAVTPKSARHSPRKIKLDLIMSLLLDESDDGQAPNIEVPLVLTGDLHFYARHYAKWGDRVRHYVICGGGGAFGLGTLLVPSTCPIPMGMAPHLEAGLEASFPDKRASTVLRRGVLRFPLINYFFSSVLAAVQLAGIGILGAHERTIQAKGGGWIWFSMSEPFSAEGLLDNVGTATSLFDWLPSLVIFWLVIAGGFVAFARSGASNATPRGAATFFGGAHVLLHFLGGLIVVWLSSQLVGKLLGTTAGWQVMATLLAFPFLYAYCGSLFGLYLFVGHVTAKLHDQEVFSAQGIESHKSFLRLKLTADALTIYPIGLTKQARDWGPAKLVQATQPSRTRHGSFAQTLTIPEGCQRVMDPTKPLAPHLIEAPIVIKSPPTTTGRV